MATPLVYDRFSVLGGFARFLRQVRAGLIINTTQSLILLCAWYVGRTILTSSHGWTLAHQPLLARSIASSVTASKCGATLCTDQRAGAAFFWIELFAWLASLALVGLTWYQQRTNPKSHPFNEPSSEFPHDPEDPFDPTDIQDAPNTAYAEGGGYRPSGDYYDGQGERGLFAERAHEYEGVGGQRFEEDDEKYHPRARDPFEDHAGGQGYEWRQSPPAGEDPYEAIRKASCRARDLPHLTRFL